MPHAVLLTGPSGCGKTTLARIGAAQIGCVESEVYERNCADERGIDRVRSSRVLFDPEDRMMHPRVRVLPAALRDAVWFS